MFLEGAPHTAFLFLRLWRFWRGLPAPYTPVRKMRYLTPSRSPTGRAEKPQPSVVSASRGCAPVARSTTEEWGGLEGEVKMVKGKSNYLRMLILM
jgi:hypothetical protein